MIPFGNDEPVCGMRLRFVLSAGASFATGACMRIGALVAALAMLTGCAVQPQGSLSSQAGTRCVSAAAISGRYVLPPDSIMFEMNGPVSYRNVLARPCPGLERLGQSAAIVFESSAGGQICAGDRVRLFDSRDRGPGRLATAPACQLGIFVPVPRRTPHS